MKPKPPRSSCLAPRAKTNAWLPLIGVTEAPKARLIPTAAGPKSTSTRCPGTHSFGRTCAPNPLDHALSIVTSNAQPWESGVPISKRLKGEFSAAAEEPRMARSRVPAARRIAARWRRRAEGPGKRAGDGGRPCWVCFVIDCYDRVPIGMPVGTCPLLEGTRRSVITRRRWSTRVQHTRVPHARARTAPTPAAASMRALEDAEAVDGGVVGERFHSPGGGTRVDCLNGLASGSS